MPDDQQQLNLSPRYLWERFQGWWRSLRVWVKVALAAGVVAGVGFAAAQISLPLAPEVAVFKDATFSFQPSAAGAAVGGTLEVALVIGNPSGQSILAAEATVTFDQTRLRITSADCADPTQSECVSAQGSAFGTKAVQALNGNTLNIVRGAPSPGVNAASATFIKLKFRALAPPAVASPVTPLTFDQANSRIVVVSQGQAEDILFRVNNGSYTIGGLVCAALPPNGYGGVVCAGAAGGKTCTGGTNAGNACTSEAQCPVPGKCKTGTGVRTCENNINISCFDDGDCETFAPCVGTSQVCLHGARAGQSCTSSADCPPRGLSAGQRCKFPGTDSICLNDPAVSCTDDADCSANQPCRAAQSVVCLGTEYPDNDTATVCCSQACTAVQAGQLYIQRVTTAVASATASGGSVSISWETYPVTMVASTCTTTVSGGTVQGTQPTTGDPEGHSVMVNASLGVHSFSISCTAPSYSPATYSGTFTINPSTAEQLRILDLAVADITYQSARVTYGTSQPAQGRVESCGGGFSAPPADTVATRAHQAQLTGLAPNTAYCVRATATLPGQPAASAETQFTTPAQTALSPDANILVRVTRDRLCKEWLYCQSAVRLKNQQGKSEDLCFDVGVCDTLDPSGACANPVALEAAQGGNMTYPTPEQIHKIKDVSGYAKVGLTWPTSHCLKNPSVACTGNAGCSTAGDTCVPDTVPGFFPYVRMSEVGPTVRVQNGNFESGQLAPWRAHAGAGLYNYRSQSADNPSYALKIVPGARIRSGARVPLGQLAAPAEPFRLTFRARTDMTLGRCVDASGVAQGGSCEVELGNGGCDPGQTCVGKTVLAHLVGVVKGKEEFNPFVGSNGKSAIGLDAGWQTFSMRLGISPDDGGLPPGWNTQTSLQFVQEESGTASPDAFYIDEVSLQPLLRVGDAETLPRACRLYPKPDAPACDFLELSSGKEWRGWKGYCVERQNPNPDRFYDPSNDCLIWWPVDVLAGAADLFSGEEVAGYKGRKPLYYCLEAAGNGPYARVTRAGDSGVTNGILYQELNDEQSAGWRAGVGPLPKSALPTESLRRVDIQRVEFSPHCDTTGGGKHCFAKEGNPRAYMTLNAQNNWTGHMVSQGDDPVPNNDWDAIALIFSNGYSEDFFGVTMEFDAQGNFIQFLTGLWNTGGDSGFVRYKVTFYLREPCNVIAQVVTPEGDSVPWTSRVTPGGWQADNAPRYPYAQDFTPYGGVVPPAGASIDPGDPTTWPGPAFVEAPLSQGGLQSPYQYRAGAPYAIKGGPECTDGVCTAIRLPGFGGGMTLQVCSNDFSRRCALNSECANICTVDPLAFTPVCISGSEELIGQSCEADRECGFSIGSGNASVPGVCSGIDKPSSIEWPAFLATLQGGSVRGAATISKLFARAYGVWAFDGTTGRYKECRLSPPSGDPNPPGCVEPWDSTATANVETTKPRVREIAIEGPTVIKRAGGIVLKFTASVNGDHLPMSGYRVNWNDGQVTEVSGLRISPKSSMSDPHIVLHTYTSNGSCTTCTPQVQVIDNWGITSDVAFYSGEITVIP